MTPVSARIVLDCPAVGPQPMTHMLALGATAGFDIVMPSRIAVSRTFDRTTEVRGRCRDARGGEHAVPSVTVYAVDAAIQRDSILSLGDAARADAGTARLTPDPRLDVVATAHARDMAERAYFAHVTPEGHDLARRLADAGIVYATAGENIGGNAGARGVVGAWLASPGHRQNLLSPAFERIGVGVFRTPSSPYTYYVQVFAK
jgi:uncharacterized protein YkwD